jgi:hypothetical protein
VTETPPIVVVRLGEFSEPPAKIRSHDRLPLLDVLFPELEELLPGHALAVLGDVTVSTVSRAVDYFVRAHQDREWQAVVRKGGPEEGILIWRKA